MLGYSSFVVGDIWSQKNGRNIIIDLSNVKDCEEKEVIIPLNIDQIIASDFSSVPSVWQLIHKKLGQQLKTVSPDHEWFDEYSIYGGSVAESGVQPKSSKLCLIKTIQDFILYCKHCAMDTDKLINPKSVPLTIKV